MLLTVNNVAAIPVGELITNGNFETGAGSSISGWTVAGTAQGRASTNVINSTGGNAGFNSLFTSRFAVLGDSGGILGGAPADGVSSISQSFTLPATIGGKQVQHYDLTVSFTSAFDGDDSATDVHDAFAAAIGAVVFSQQDSTPLPDCQPPSASCPNNQLVIPPPASFAVTGLAPGIYALIFGLNEAAGSGASATNTAVGLDNVSVTGEAVLVVAAGPVTMVLLAAGGLVGFIVHRIKVRRDAAHRTA
jgi:hypothetical protein